MQHLIFDGNHLFHKTFSVWSTYYRGQDMETVLKSKENRQILLRKCIIDLCHTVKKFRNVKDVTVVIDSSSWRYKFYADYKYALTRVKESHYQQFLECLNEFEQFLRDKGLIVSRVQGAEGDDLMYIWALYYGFLENEHTVIVTGDSDIRQLITRNVSLYNNNSKNLRIYCHKDCESYWRNNFDADTEIVETEAFEVLLYKVIMGDTSDNIPKLRQGFGKKAFDKFLESIRPYNEPTDVSLAQMAMWIVKRFAEFTHTPEEQYINNVIFNLQMTWLNLSAYNESGVTIPLLKRMLKEANALKGSYRYDGQYTLESMYGMLIK